MSMNTSNDNNSDPILKPELAFDWIKYKKEPFVIKSTVDAIAQFVSDKKHQTKQVQQQEPSLKDIQQEPDKKIEQDPLVGLNLRKDDFKNDAAKERIFLWIEKISTQKDLSMEELSKAINIPDLMELEEFLFRHPPLKYGYQWRGKNLKFTDESINKLQELLN